MPAPHLSGESKDVVKLGLGAIATLTALLLGLWIASAKGTYDTQSGAVKQLSANIVLLDRLLARYGPQTKEARKLFQRFVTITLESLWPEDRSQKAILTAGGVAAEMEAFYDKLGADAEDRRAARHQGPRPRRAGADDSRGRFGRWLLEPRPRPARARLRTKGPGDER